MYQVGLNLDFMKQLMNNEINEIGYYLSHVTEDSIIGISDWYRFWSFGFD